MKYIFMSVGMFCFFLFFLNQIAESVQTHNEMAELEDQHKIMATPAWLSYFSLNIYNCHLLTIVLFGALWQIMTFGEPRNYKQSSQKEYIMI